jgi:hypothetical protein
VAAHTTKDTGIWVSYQNGVYDIFLSTLVFIIFHFLFVIVPTFFFVVSVMTYSIHHSLYGS